ncbi:cellulose-binding protein, partial [Streptomyces sp. NPDC059409]
ADDQLPGLHADGVPTQDVDQQWLARGTAPRPTALRLGWESYASGDDTVWFDDVAVGSAPIGC